MYIGRIVSIALTTDGRLCASYRVSSRSFPNRMAVLATAKASIIPKPRYELDVQKNPYIAYNCVRIVCANTVAVVSNGSQTDPIAEKIDMGMPVRDAMASCLFALDFEKDQFNTPRIVAVADKRGSGSGWLGIVREDGLSVRRIPLEAGEFWYVATYEENLISPHHSGEYTASTADEACGFILSGGVFAERENAVSAVAAMADATGFTLAAKGLDKE